MRTNNSAHQLIQNKDGLFLNAYDPACTPVFEWIADPTRAWVFHPTNPKGKDLLVRLLNAKVDAKIIDRAEAVRIFNKAQQ
jgi:hypothetical protein